MRRTRPSPSLFPYTTLFRSRTAVDDDDVPGHIAREVREEVENGACDVVGLAATAERNDLTDAPDRKSTRLNSSHGYTSYAGFCLKKKKRNDPQPRMNTRQ